VYAGAAGVVLEPTPGDQSAKIIVALDGLSAGGSTNGGAGIRLAYALARQAWIDGGINRVLLATDGDFNVGTVDFEMLKQLVAEQRNSGIGLTTLGFGSGNYNDHLMEQLADAGSGNYAYIDTLGEARKALVDSVSSTLLTIAKDVKIQVEFNPATVAEYRLIGYENRALEREDFANDKVDAGEIGAGHSVTAIYEIALQGSDGVRLDDSRYQPAAQQVTVMSGELALVRVRYKAPDGDRSELLQQPVLKSTVHATLQQTSERYRFAAAVAAFGQLLREGKYTGEFAYADVLELARNARGADPFGYRGEFLQLAGLASSL
jgi:Ca-activated chloride channel family protein